MHFAAEDFFFETPELYLEMIEGKPLIAFDDIDIFL